MSIKKSVFVIISVRIKKFPIFILLPLRCVSEVIEGAMDIICLFKRISKKAFPALCAAEDVMMMVQSYGPLDVVDVNVKSREENVKIKMLLR